jgi:hypothetical protein
LSTESTAVVPTTGAATAPTEFSQPALTLTVQIRELGRTVEGFRYAPKGRRSAIGTRSSLPEEFLLLLAADLDVNPALATQAEITGTEIRECLSFAREFGNASAETRLVAKGMDDTIAERMADVGERALRAYYYAQRANRKDSKASVVPHLEAMKRALGKGRRTKKKEDPATAKKGGDPAKPPQKGDAK